MSLVRFAATGLALAMCVVAGHPRAEERTTMGLVERYAAGEFDAVVAELQQVTDFERILRDIRRHAPEWVLAGGDEDRERRQLAVATFGLEAARAAQWREWKWIITPPPMTAVLSTGDKEIFRPLNTLQWRAAPLLIEWGCALFRADQSPRPIERWWQLAALAVAQRSEDPQFLVGDPAVGEGREAGEVINPQNEIKHLDHVEKRFPAEVRFTLAQGTARFRMWQDDARQVFTALRTHVDVGGEAAVRLGQMALTEEKYRDAYAQFAHADKQTRDPWVLYLARYLRGVGQMRQGHFAPAEASFRSALHAWPRAQSASTALASLLLRRDQRQEAQRIAALMLSTEPPIADPWRGFVHADDRFWPMLVGKLRAEIRR